jgi:tetratricopeptide (TPR) repeat protein
MKKPDWMFQLACVAMVCVSLIASDDVIAQSVGDRVVATANVYTKILNKQVGKVFGGEIDTVTDINGKWCALSRTKGWLPMQYVMTLDSGEKYYSERIKKNRNDFDAWAIRGMIRFENDRLRDALEDLNQSIVLRKTNPVTFNNRGIILHAMGRNQEALTNVDQAIKLNPNYADAHENRGLFLVSLGQYPEAMKSFEQAIKLRKGNPYAYINRGTARSNAGDYKGAKADFLQALSMERDLSDAYVTHAIKSLE